MTGEWQNVLVFFAAGRSRSRLAAPPRPQRLTAPPARAGVWLLRAVRKRMVRGAAQGRWGGQRGAHELLLQRSLVQPLRLTRRRQRRFPAQSTSCAATPARCEPLPLNAPVAGRQEAAGQGPDCGLLAFALERRLGASAPGRCPPAGPTLGRRGGGRCARAFAQRRASRAARCKNAAPHPARLTRRLLQNVVRAALRLTRRLAAKPPRQCPAAPVATPLRCWC